MPPKPKSTSPHPLQTIATAGFTKLFNAPPQLFATAPGRVNLIGEHIDYCDGWALPFAIERSVLIAARPNQSNSARIASALDQQIIELPLAAPIEPGPVTWANYPLGVIAGFATREITIPGFDAYMVSNIPIGAGLSSSAALECATASLLQNLTESQLSRKELALLCQQAEHQFAGVPCGIMDQFASMFGQTDSLVLIDCLAQEPSLIPFNDPNLTILIANTKVQHQLADGAYAERRKSTENAFRLMQSLAQPTAPIHTWRDISLDYVAQKHKHFSTEEFKRSMHVVSEIHRTLEAVEALKNSAAAVENRAAHVLGELMNQSHNSLRDHFEVSCKELDLMVDLARQLGPNHGVLGSRMTGGGFGGSTVTLCKIDHAEHVANHLTVEYQKQTGITPEIFTSRPAAGASSLL